MYSIESAIEKIKNISNNAINPSYWWIREQIITGNLKAKKVGRRWAINETSLMSFIEKF